MYQRLSLSHVGPGSGDRRRPPGRCEKRIRDLGGIHAGPAALRALAEVGPGRVVHCVHQVRPRQAQGDLIFGTTLMGPGRVGAELLRTRRHTDTRSSRRETRPGQSGPGVTLPQSPDGATRILETLTRLVVNAPPWTLLLASLAAWPTWRGSWKAVIRLRPSPSPETPDLLDRP